MFKGQRGISEFLVVLVLFCVPFMLCVKPCATMCCPHYAGLEPASDAHDEHAAEVADAFEADPNGNDNQITSRGGSAQENIKEY